MGRGPSSGVPFPSLIAIEWVGDPFSCVAFAWPAALQLSALVGQWTFLPCSVGGSRTCKCSEGEARVEDPRRCLHALDSGPNVEYIYSAQVLARR